MLEDSKNQTNEQPLKTRTILKIFWPTTIISFEKCTNMVNYNPEEKMEMTRAYVQDPRSTTLSSL